MSSGNPYYVGLQNVGSYQVAGIPFATASLTAPATGSTALRITFPSVTNWIHIGTLSNAHIRVGFSENGVHGSNYVIIHEENHPTHFVMNVKVSEIYLSSNNGSPVSDCYVMAGLTNIDTSLLELSGPSGSNWSGSLGVG